MNDSNGARASHGGGTALIAITGSDGSGKSSMVELLATRRGQRVRVVDRWDVLNPELHPQCAFISASRDELRAQMSAMPPVARSLFLFWTFSMMLDGALGADCSLALTDGYWMKHAAAEVVYGADRRWIEAMARTLPAPRLTVLLDIDPVLALARKRGALVPYECGMDRDMRDASFIAHQSALRDVLLGWARERGWLCLDATEPLPRLVDRVERAIQELDSSEQRDRPSHRCVGAV